MKERRKLSEHMGSRWYRAPEVILMQKQYDQGIDMWALGCILEELIHCSEPYIKELTKPLIERHVLTRISFPGTSCFPLSPCRSKSNKPGKYFVEETD